MLLVPKNINLSPTWSSHYIWSHAPGWLLILIKRFWIWCSLRIMALSEQSPIMPLRPVMLGSLWLLLSHAKGGTEVSVQMTPFSYFALEFLLYLPTFFSKWMAKSIWRITLQNYSCCRLMHSGGNTMKLHTDLCLHHKTPIVNWMWQENKSDFPIILNSRSCTSTQDHQCTVIMFESP